MGWEGKLEDMGLVGLSSEAGWSPTVTAEDCLSSIPRGQWPLPADPFHLCRVPESSLGASATSLIPRSLLSLLWLPGPLLSLSPGLSGQRVGLAVEREQRCLPPKVAQPPPGYQKPLRGLPLLLPGLQLPGGVSERAPPVLLGHPDSPGINSEPGHQPAGQPCSALGGQWAGTKKGPERVSMRAGGQAVSSSLRGRWARLGACHVKGSTS